MICATVGLTAFIVAYSLSDRASKLPAAIGQTLCVAAYMIALFSCWRAAALYPKKSPIRLGWLAMSGTCFLSMFRHAALNPFFERLAGTRDRVYLISQTLQLPALILLLLGMLAIWWGVYRLGLGFRIRWLDCLGIACVAGIVPGLSAMTLATRTRSTASLRFFRQ